jgi:tRNA pseudouridine32 synthase/23S rRNA pseudouridine746 synthase
MYRLIARHESFIVISKAPGVSVHRDDAETGLVEQIERDLGQKLWLVHRLDRITSGLLLLATSAAACERLAALFRSRQVEKFYLALSDRKPAKKQGSVIGDMVKSRRGSWRLLRGRDNPAMTEFRSASAGPGLRLLLCRPATGQTHQIRVALKSLGAPIIGDPIYHEAVVPAPDRGYLHAWQLRFSLDGCDHHFTAEPDSGELFRLDSVRAAIAPWQAPWQLDWKLIGRAPAGGV